MWITSAFSVDNLCGGLWITSAGCFPGSVRPSGCGPVPAVAEGWEAVRAGSEFFPLGVASGGSRSGRGSSAVVRWAGASGSVRPCRSVRGGRPWARASVRPAASDPVRVAAGPGRAWPSLGERRAGGLIMGRRSGGRAGGCGPGSGCVGPAGAGASRARANGFDQRYFPGKALPVARRFDCVCNLSRYG